MDENDKRIQGYLDAIINTLTTRDDNHLRELLIILLRMEINEDREGSLYNLCVTVWEKINKKPSVRFNAFRMILKIARKHPDLSQEVLLLTQNQYMNSLSPTAKRSIFKMIKKLYPQIFSV